VGRNEGGSLEPGGPGPRAGNGLEGGCFFLFLVFGGRSSNYGLLGRSSSADIQKKKMEFPPPGSGDGETSKMAGRRPMSGGGKV